MKSTLGNRTFQLAQGQSAGVTQVKELLAFVITFLIKSSLEVFAAPSSIFLMPASSAVKTYSGSATWQQGGRGHFLTSALLISPPISCSIKSAHRLHCLQCRWCLSLRPWHAYNTPWWYKKMPSPRALQPRGSGLNPEYGAGINRCLLMVCEPCTVTLRVHILFIEELCVEHRRA